MRSMIESSLKVPKVLGCRPVSERIPIVSASVVEHYRVRLMVLEDENLYKKMG
jgi:hypothetical protein